ncbi:MAG: DUF3244 domain-containing protein [Bacteroidales bacterium]|nr:DUF3244 domain-containing protein [Bacteroidales bacterium]
MKAKLLFLITALIAVANTFSAEAQVVPINIVREPTPPGSEVSHRAPAQVPINCFLEDNSYLVVNFFADLGTVAVEIENRTTGELTQTTVNAFAGTMVFPISASQGHWVITFTLQGGVIYYGEFNL